MNLLLLWLTQTPPPAEGFASPRYIILAVIVVLYVVYRIAAKRSKPIPPRRPKY